MIELWRHCLSRLETELSVEDVHTYLAPLQAEEDAAGIVLWAPNAYTMEAVRERFLNRIGAILEHLGGAPVAVDVQVGARPPAVTAARITAHARPASGPAFESNLDSHYTFENFVEGKSNQLGKAASTQIAINPGQKTCNPLVLYGGTGLGKTHLMYAAGNLMCANHPDMKVLYLRSEQFVNGMVRALRQNSMDEFKRRFRSVDALLIDDFQFFAGKNTSQEEFFHTFNVLYDGKQQIILTCDRYPKEVKNLDPRLKSRLGWGLQVAIEPHDFETRAAIVLTKAQAKGVELPEEVALLMAKHIRSNVRELEGALNTLVARANFEGRPISPAFAQETLRDLLTVHAEAITIPNIQKVVAEYYNLRVADMLSQKRNRAVARPRQMAMALAKELTEHSLPEIGDVFGGRDHTTVLHACRTIRDHCKVDGRMQQDWGKLMRALTE